MVASQDPVTQPGQKSRKRGNVSCTSCWDLVHPWSAALCRSTSTWDAHTCCLLITSLGYSGLQGNLKGSALSKMHAVVVCVFTPVFSKSEQSGPLEYIVTTRSLKVCCLSINRMGVSVSSAVYKLDLSLQFLVPCLYAPLRGVQQPTPCKVWAGQPVAVERVLTH